MLNGQNDQFVKKLNALIPLGRMAKKNEYRAAIQFLCSDASSYMNGQNIIIMEAEVFGNKKEKNKFEETIFVQSVIVKIY